MHIASHKIELGFPSCQPNARKYRSCWGIGKEFDEMREVFRLGWFRRKGPAHLYICKGGERWGRRSRMENRDAGCVSPHLCKTRKGGPATTQRKPRCVEPRPRSGFPAEPLRGGRLAGKLGYVPYGTSPLVAPPGAGCCARPPTLQFAFLHHKQV